jgi:hypothetical protein
VQLSGNVFAFFGIFIVHETGNSPEVIRKNYFTGIDLVNAREILEHTIS